MGAIRLAVFDRHPATRAGLEAILRAQPGMASVGAAPTAASRAAR